MPQVGVNNEPLLERAIFGYDGTDYRVVKVDSDGNLVAAVKASQVVEVEQATAADLKATVDVAADQNIQARVHGYDGAAWQKSALLWGYSDVVSEVLSDTNLAAGTTVLTGTGVSSGEIWVVEVALVHYKGTSPTEIDIAAIVGGVTIYALREANPTSNQGYQLSGRLVLKAGDSMEARVIGATAGDALRFYYAGYKMEVS